MMKTPEEIKKGLECCYGNEEKRFCEMCPFGVKTDDIYPTLVCSNFDAVGEGALAYIQQLEAQAPKWISVEERLPEDDIDVLVYAIGNNEESVIAMTSYTHNMHGYNIEGWRSPWQYFFHEYKITHWMPLPEPPKEEEHAQTD